MYMYIGSVSNLSNESYQQIAAVIRCVLMNGTQLFTVSKLFTDKPRSVAVNTAHGTDP